MKKLAFIVGRFQPFHKGHQHLVDASLDFDKVIIFLGSSQENRTKKNPLNFEERKIIIESYYNMPHKMSFFPLEDKESDKDWTDQIKETLQQYENEYEIYSICCNKDESTKESNDLFNSLNVNKLLIKQGLDIDATNIRKKLFDDFIDPESITELHDDTKLFFKEYLHNLKIGV